MNDHTAGRSALFAVVVIGVACVGAAAPVAGDQPTTARPTLAIRDVTVLPMTGGPPMPHRTVLVDGAVIIEIADTNRAITDGIPVVDGGGRFLFPGLVDAHVHLRRADLASYLADGVLTVRNMWGHSGIKPLIEQIDAGTVLGPRVVSLSPGIDGSPPQWPETELLNDPAQAEGIVARLADAGWKTLKVYQNLSLASFDAVAKAAARHQVEFAGHVPSAVPIEHALASGMRTIEHYTGYDRAFSARRNGGTWGWGDASLADASALVNETVTSRVWNVPTLAIYTYLAQQHPAEFRERVIQNRRAFTRLLADAGAHLAAGTDAGIDVIPAKGALFAELKEFEASGLSREAVLEMATSNASGLLRIPGLGSVKVGAPARLLLLDADPLKELSALQQISAVILDGKLLTPAADCARRATTSAESSMRLSPLRVRGIAAASIALLGCAGAEPSQEGSVAGTYDTDVSLTSASTGCTLGVQKNPTVVQTSNNNTVVTLTHAGTTYGGELKADKSFTTQVKNVAVGGVNYAIVVSGKFTGNTLDANVTLDYGTAPSCHVAVRWVGAKP